MKTKELGGERHFITNAAKNTSAALMMAMEVWESTGVESVGVQGLVQILNATAIQLKRRCRCIAYEVDIKGTEK